MLFITFVLNLIIYSHNSDYMIFKNPNKFTYYTPNVNLKHFINFIDD